MGSRAGIYVIAENPMNLAPNPSTSTSTGYYLMVKKKSFVELATFQVSKIISCTTSTSSGFVMAKKVRTEDVDRISLLPDAILSHILSFLSTKEAVGTSILSTRWRYLFALVSNLDFELDDKLLLRRNKSKSSTIKIFASFVDRVLFFHNTTSVEKFRLKCGKEIDSSRVYGWISAALWRGVQHLDLKVSIDKFTTLPGVLFTCRTLVTLKLDINFVLDVPNYVYFSNLRTLHLKSIEFLNDHSVESLFSSCISLEDMIIKECKMKNVINFNISHNLLKRLTIVRSTFYNSEYRIVIDTPTLAYYKHTDYLAAGYSLRNLQSLVRADIDFLVIDANLPADATAFFRGICNVRSLNLSCTSLKLLLSCESLPVFPNLVQLKICYGYGWSSPKYYYWEKGFEILLASSRELGKLAFYQEVLSSLPEKVPFCVLFKLKVIEISEFEAEKGCIEKAKFFLMHARVLEKLTIRTKSYLSEEKKLKISKELLASPRKSKQWCILIV